MPQTIIESLIYVSQPLMLQFAIVKLVSMTTPLHSHCVHSLSLSPSLPLYPSLINDCAILKLLFFTIPFNNACFMLLFHFTTYWFVLALKALPSTLIALKWCFHVGQYADEISITYFIKMYFPRKIKNEYSSLLRWQRYS